MSYKPEYYDRDRVTGLQLAKTLGASKTAEVIGDKTKSFKNIFDAAVSELGLDKVADALMQAPPVWAHAALLSVPDWGPHRQALLTRAGEAPDGTVSPGSATSRPVPSAAATSRGAAAAVMGGPLSKMRLNNHMAANCQWTIEWFDGKDQPADKYPDWNKWKWSGTLTAGSGSDMSVIDCRNQVPLSPLNNGDVIWIYVWVQAGTDKNGKTDLPSFQFTYDSGSPVGAEFGISGTTTINTLSVETYPKT